MSRPNHIADCGETRDPRFGHGPMSHPSPSVGGVRLIHTSDWHLGRAFHQVGLLDAQAAYLDHLVEVVRAERGGRGARQR